MIYRLVISAYCFEVYCSVFCRQPANLAPAEAGVQLLCGGVPLLEKQNAATHSLLPVASYAAGPASPIAEYWVCSAIKSYA